MKAWITFLVFAVAIVCFAQEPATTLPTVKVAANVTFMATGDESIAPTTLFTPTAAGEYRVSVYGEVDSPSSGTIPINFLWTDDFGSFTKTNGCITDQMTSSSSSACESTVRIHVAANDPIQYSISNQGVAGITQTFYVTVEKLP
jgi:hypothetical protein